MPQPTRTAVLQALANVQEPAQKRDVVALGMVKDIQISADGRVNLIIETAPGSANREQIEREVKLAVSGVDGVSAVSVLMGTRNPQPAAGATAGPRAAGARGPTAGGPSGTQPIPGVKNIIAVSSGKGGVGKSTVAVNLAVSLAQSGARVGLMDADVYGPNIPTMMGVTEQPTIQQHPELGEVFLPPSAHGVKVMSMGFLIQGDQPLVWRGPMLHNVVSQFCHKVNWGELDYLVVDMPPGTGDIQLSLAQLVPVSGAVLVTTPQEVSMQDVRKAFSMFEKVRIPILGIVENMSFFRCDGCEKKHFLFGEGGGAVLAKRLGAELLAQVPILPEVQVGGDIGRPVSTQAKAPTASPYVREVGATFANLAGKVSQKIAVSASQGIDPTQIVQIGKFT